MAEELFPPTKRIKSAVWEYFGYRKNDQGVVLEDGVPACKSCYKKIAAKGGNTSNMFHHLRDNHSTLYAKIKVNTQ